jgi:hypothetical protein
MTFACPRCQRQLEQDGEIQFEGKTLPVFQCPSCLVTVDLAGEPFQTNLTFCVQDGVPFDPGSPDGRLPV